MSRDDYESGYRCLSTIPPTPTAKLRCGRCRFVGDMPVRQIEFGNGGDSEDLWQATCPRCWKTQTLDGDEQPCAHCGVEDQPDMLMDIDGDLLCVRCRRDAWDAAIARIQESK